MRACLIHINLVARHRGYLSKNQMLAYLVLDNLSIDLEVLTKDGVSPLVSGLN